MTAERYPDALETRLRAALADLRPTDGAPEGLRARIDMVPNALGVAGLSARLRRLLATPAVVATLATAAAITILTIAIHPIVGPQISAGGSAPAPTFDPSAEGPGLVYDVVPTLVIVPGLVALLALGFAVRHLRRARWIGGLEGVIKLGALGVVVASATALAVHPGFTWGGGSLAPVLGWGVQVDQPPGSLDSAPVWYETVNPGDPLILAVSIKNPGPLPIRLEGIVEDPQTLQMVITRWIGMTYATDETRIPQALSELSAFTPSIVQPNEQLLVYLVARAGKCSYGPSFTLGTTDAAMGGYSTRDRVIHFAYSVFGLSASAPYELPVTLVEPMRNGCGA